MREDDSKEIQRWTAKRRAALVIGIIKGDTSVVEDRVGAETKALHLLIV